MLVEFAEESKERWKLMEMPTHLLENNQKLYIKGAQGTDAVLCSDSHTYTIRNALTSNSLLITTTSHDNLLYSTVKTAHAQLQLTPCIPKTDHINHLLAASLYKGPAQEASLDHQKLYTFDRLLKNIQASRQEIQTALSNINAILLDGYYRLIEPIYQTYILEMIITSAIIEDQDLNALRLQSVTHFLSSDDENLPDCVVISVLRSFSDVSFNDDGNEIYSLSEYKICRFYGHEILKNHSGPPMSLYEFFETWKKSLPEPFKQLDLSQLKALYILEDEHFQDHKTIVYFPKSLVIQQSAGLVNQTYQQTTRKRFQYLFEKKKTWTFDEIVPYVCDLIRKDKEETLVSTQGNAKTEGDVKALNALLLKCARVHHVDGIVLYTKK